MILSGMFAAGITVLVWVIAQILLLGFFDRRLHFRIRLFFYGLSLLVFLFWQWSTPAFNILNGTLLHLLFFCTFMELYYAIDRPVTLRILIEAQKATPSVLDANKLYQSYDLNYMIGRRLNSLTAGGYLLKKGDYYYLTSKGRFFARIFDKGSRLFGVR